jgi:16S rRNA (guanine527-N7)-methyltransferase
VKAGERTQRAVAEGRLAALVARYGLDTAAEDRLRTLLWLLAVDPRAATAIRDPVKVVDDHLADSLSALELAAVTGARRAVDIGSGAGLPGLPLAIARPDAHFTLLESAARKCAFLERAVTEVGIANVTVVNGRAESWAGGLGGHDLVTARALARADVVAEYASPLLAVGGSLVDWRGRRDAAAEAALGRAAGRLGLGAPEIRRVQPYAGARHRHLYVLTKQRETPSGFPRRPGIALKRPLGAP